jgi:hypothetical protein
MVGKLLFLTMVKAAEELERRNAVAAAPGVGQKVERVGGFQI